MATEHETQVDILQQFEGAVLNEVKMGKPQTIIDSAEVIVVSFVPTEAQVEAAAREMGLPLGSITVGDGTPLTFVFVGEYKIPVNKSILILQSGAADFTYVLPNHMFLQILLPLDADPQDLDAFEHIMYSYGNLKKKPMPATSSAPVARSTVTAAVATTEQQPKRISTRLAIGLGKITKGACYGITKGAELISHGVTKGTDKIVEVTEPCREAVKVSESTKGHINRARMATKGVAVMSGTVATAMVGVTAVLGNFIGTRVANRVSKADDGDSTSAKLSAVKEVGGAAIGCIGLLFDAASDAGKTILTSSCDGISKVVTHKLGDEAGAVTANGLGVVTDVVDIQSNVRKAGIKGIVTATAQSSAVTMIGELEKKQQPHPV